MQRLITNLATLAAMVVLAAGLWQDWSLLTTTKRMLLGYLGFFLLGSLGVLAIQLAGVFDKEQPEPEERKKAPDKAPAEEESEAVAS
jgi:hypothetical protein